MKKEFCGNCRFVGKEAKTESLSMVLLDFARRYPPTVVVIDEKEEFSLS